MSTPKWGCTSFYKYKTMYPRKEQSEDVWILEYGKGVQAEEEDRRKIGGRRGGEIMGPMTEMGGNWIDSRGDYEWKTDRNLIWSNPIRNNPIWN